MYLNYAVFDGQSLRGIYWQHNPAFLNAAFVDSLVSWYPYSADRRAIGVGREMLDYAVRLVTATRRTFSESCSAFARPGREPRPTFCTTVLPTPMALCTWGTP